jgi:alkylhydroperoxidase family enzyme
MSYYLKTTSPDEARGRLKATYEKLESMFMVVPKVFVAQSIRPDLLEAIVTYVKRLMIDDHALPRSTKELIAARVSQLNSCAY